MFFLPSLLYFGRSAASGLPCAGAAPPQRPPTKPSLTDLVSSFQQCRSTNLAAANRRRNQIARMAAAIKGWSRHALYMA